MRFVPALLAIFYFTMRAPAQQTSMMVEPGWNIKLSKEWDVLGPFPISAREQQFISPSFPLNVSQPIDFAQTWPSSYADGGRVGWSNATMTADGELSVSFPEIRWRSLRATEGWAALQHHALLHSTLTLYPNNPVKPPNLLIDLIQGSYFAITSYSSTAHHTPHWYSGNIYAMERGLPQVISLPTLPSTTEPTVYDIFVSGDYEIRLFGDPAIQGSEIPVQTLKLHINVDSYEEIVREPSQDVICDFVDGEPFGNALGVGLRSTTKWWSVTSIVTKGKTADSLSLELLHKVRIAPGQMRIVPVKIALLNKHRISSIDFDVTLTSDKGIEVISVIFPVSHIPQWSEEVYVPIMATYFFARSMPTLFTAIPPKVPSRISPPILALHGAGVDIVSQDFWVHAFPRNQRSWYVLPSGRTSWGLDWHGPSADDAWASVEALEHILSDSSMLRGWEIARKSKVLLIGHSNGGQGAWYLASRYPDRVMGVVPAAAYIKSQAYVPLVMSRSSHYIDPSLRAILESSLTPDDNDIFLTNLINTPVLAIHGGNDENVPTWHSREAVSVLKTLNPQVNATYWEVPGEGHWFDTLFKNERVSSFVDEVLSTPAPATLYSFILTVSLPTASGSMQGWRIETLNTPGRLARLIVKRTGKKATVISSNVDTFSIDLSVFSLTSIHIDNTFIVIPSNNIDVVCFEAVDSKMWKLATHQDIQLSGRVQNILTTQGPLVLVIPDDVHAHEMTVALRIAHDLNLYHRLDSEIIMSSEALSEESLQKGNVVVIGNQASMSLSHLHDPTRISAFGAKISLNAVPQPSLTRPGLGLLFLHSHPSLREGTMVFMQSTDTDGLEKAVRLFPIRTGIPVPDWIIIGPEADSLGAAAVLAAGVWDSDWNWNEKMSWTQ